MTFRDSFKPAAAGLAALLVAGCGGSPSTSSVTNPDPAGFAASGSQVQVRFDLATSDVPLPIALLQSPTTGLNTLPGAGEPVTSFNSIQGMSTAGPILINFTGLLDPASVNAGTILVINTATSLPVALDFETQVLTPGQTTVFAYPRTPLAPATQYLVVVTNRVSSGGQVVRSSQSAGLLKFTSSLLAPGGGSAVASLSDAQAQALEPVRQAWQAVWAGAEAATGSPRADIPLAFTFTTQPLFQTLPVLQARADAGAPTPVVTQSFVGPVAVDAFYTAAGLAAVPHGNIDAVYLGFFTNDGYLSDPLDGPFAGPANNPTVADPAQVVPFIATRGASTAAGTVIYGHGITRSKNDWLVMADGAAANGLAGFSIDFALHGDRALPGQPSGTGFINLNNLRMSRDNIRQTVSDLFWATEMIQASQTAFEGGEALFRNDNIVYAGQSLGGIVGTTFLATEPGVTLGALNVPGGRIASLLKDSPGLSPTINAGLAAAGILPGTPDYEQFFWVAQTVTDDADAFNYGARVLSGALKGDVATNVLVQQMNGDLVVPNSATTDLVRSMGLTHVLGVQGGTTPAGVATANAPFSPSGFFQYQGGQHGFLLDPTQGPTAQGQSQLFTYLLSGLGFVPGAPGPLIIDPFDGVPRADASYSFPYTLKLDSAVHF